MAGKERQKYVCPSHQVLHIGAGSTSDAFLISYIAYTGYFFKITLTLLGGFFHKGGDLHPARAIKKNTAGATSQKAPPSVNSCPISSSQAPRSISKTQQERSATAAQAPKSISKTQQERSATAV
jgi:hypothetical protein